MSSTETPVIPTAFFNIYVVAVPTTGKEGETVYKTHFTPEAIDVQQLDTVLNYQLIAPTPAGVRIDNVTISPDGSQEFSVPSISRSGKLATFSDANLIDGTFGVTLHFSDDKGVKFKVDPQIVNRPPM